MPARCCRSCPRCAVCPVLVQSRRRAEAKAASVVEDILVGAPRKRLPANVVATLASLDAARRAPRRPLARAF